MPLPAVGAPAPEFTLPDLDGHPVALADLLRSGPVGLFFLKAGCGASDLAAPAVEPIWDGYSGQVSPEGTRLSLLCVSQDAPATAREEHARLRLSAPMVSDEGLRVSAAYDLQSTPTFILLAGEERLRADAIEVAPAAARRVVDVVEAWSRDAYVLLSEEIAARVGAIPVDLSLLPGPAFRPG